MAEAEHRFFKVGVYRHIGATKEQPSFSQSLSPILDGLTSPSSWRFSGRGFVSRGRNKCNRSATLERACNLSFLRPLSRYAPISVLSCSHAFVPPTAALCSSSTELIFNHTLETISIRNGGNEQLSVTNLNLREDTEYFRITSKIILPLEIAAGRQVDLQLSFFPGAASLPVFNLLDVTTDSTSVRTISILLKGLHRPSNMKVEILNPDAYDMEKQVRRPGFYHDWIVFNKIRDGLNAEGFQFSISDTAVVKIFNRYVRVLLPILLADGSLRDLAAPLSILNATLSNTMWKVLSPPAERVPAGGGTEIALQFVSREGAKGPREATLLIKTDDPAAPEIPITLSCGYMEYREDTNELSLSTILRTFGYSINIYHPLSSGFMSLPWLRTSRLVGDEVRALTWMRASDQAPFWARSLAAFLLVIYKEPEAETMIILGPGGGAIAIDPKYGQSYLPRALGKQTPAEGYFNTTGPFSVILSHKFETTGMVWSSNNTKDLNLHFFPLRDRRSRVHPGTYVIAHDFILPRGCCIGPGCANCDFQDNIYIASNLMPADDNAHLPPAYDLGSPELILAFDAAINNSLPDGAGLGIGFVATQRNDDDVTPGSASFNPALISLDLEGKKLKMASTLGSNRGAINRQVNALGLWYNAESDPYFILTRIEGPLSLSRVGEEACVWVGADKDNYAKLCVVYDETFSLAFSFMSEMDGVPSPPTLQKLDGVESVRALDLYLLITPQARTIVPAFAINGNTRSSLGDGIFIRERYSGLFFGPRIWAGVLVAQTGSGTSFKTTFLRFSVSPDVNSAELMRHRTHALGVPGQNVQICNSLSAAPPSVSLAPAAPPESEAEPPTYIRAPALVRPSPSSNSVSTPFGLPCLISALICATKFWSYIN